MRIPRIYFPKCLKTANKITLDKEASNHIIRVLRLKPSASLTVFNEENGEYNAVLISENKNLAEVLIGESIQKNPESPLKIHLGQAISRGEKMDFTIQKATELGVNAITPLFTKYSNVTLNNERLTRKMDHWQKIALNATEQSGRIKVPNILAAQNVSDWITKNSNLTKLNFILEPSAKESLSTIQKQNPKTITAINLLIGSEGGFSEEEIILAKKMNFIPISLGPRILRTETAALVAISILQSLWGDLL